MQRLTVLNVGYPLAKGGINAVGGAEQVLGAIDQHLVSAGHRSLVIAPHGSTAAGSLISYPEAESSRPFDGEVLCTQRARVREILEKTLSDIAVDIVHMHGIDFHEYLPASDVPVLATLHLPLAWYPTSALAASRASTWLNCVSASQMKRGSTTAQMLPPIDNGVFVEELGSIRLRRRNYLLVLARICPEKGQHLALEAAHRADVSLIVAGEVFPYPEHQEYFASRVQPLLDHKRRYVGPVGFFRKRRLLTAARGLLVPSLADETSSLVAMEAASCGTPVIGLRAGALPDVVEEGRTGFIVDDVDGMTEAIDRIEHIDPVLCRDVARRRFSMNKMTEAYVGYYRELARPIRASHT